MSQQSDADLLFGHRLRNAREARGKSLRQLAAEMQQAGFTEFQGSTISRIESGKRKLGLSEALKMTDLLGIHLKDITRRGRAGTTGTDGPSGALQHFADRSSELQSGSSTTSLDGSTLPELLAISEMILAIQPQVSELAHELLAKEVQLNTALMPHESRRNVT